MDHRPPPEPAARPDDLPSISDYWPDAPHRMGPAADYEHFDTPFAPEGRDDPVVRTGPADPAAALPGPAPRRRRTGVFVALAFVLVGALGAGAVLALRDRGTPDSPGPVRPAAPAAGLPDGTGAEPSGAASAGPSGEPGGGVLTGPVDDRTAAAFELVSDASLIDLRTADLGGDLYRVTAPQGSSVQPRITDDDGTVRLFLDPTGNPGAEEVDVVLSRAVLWRLTVTGGVRRGNLDLAGAAVDGVTLAGDAARIDLTLPRPDGTLPIRMSGGVNQFEVRTDRGVPVRIRTRSGAGVVTFDGRKKDGVARGAAFQNREWPGSENRVDLDAVAGVGTLTLGRS